MAADDDKTQNYNRFKQHQGKQYSGMPVGRSHKWYYDRGEWRERKLTPDEWEISYQTTKHRAAEAPENSGAPVGTEYNWLIVSHQRVDKLDANSYMTCMEGKKFKVAHKRANKDAWSTSEGAQRKQVIRYLEQVIQELKQADESDVLPFSVGEHDHVYGLNLKTKAELMDIARDCNLEGRSRMKRGELLEAVRACVYPQGSADNGNGPRETSDSADPDLRSKTRDELYRMAGDRAIDGRSKMNKAQLVAALESHS